MTETEFDFEPGREDLLFVPLGGTGEIGMNLNLYGHDGAWLMVDLGIAFSRGEIPGVEVFMPDPAFIEERRDRLAGIVLTHAHEDHIGAVPYLWPRLRAPLYATPFTAGLVRRKLAEAGLAEVAPVTEVPLSGQFSVGPFEIELITLTHSIPEPNALVIRTKAGTVMHTGDWKLDPDPLVGDDFDRSRLEALAEEEVLAMVCDSTNAMVEGHTGSEAAVREALVALIGGLKQRVAVACFASNVARLETVIAAASEAGRRVALVGRSMHRIVEVARESGYLEDLPPLLRDDEVDYLPRDEVLLLCTGSQGEKRSALWRIVHDDHREVFLDRGDAVIFSARVIPGNEIEIFGLQNALVERGLEIYTDNDHPIHVSGHPARDDLSQMYQWVRPKVAVPVHGEPRHLHAHADLAAECQVPQRIVTANGRVVRLAPGEPREIGEVPSGRTVVDGRRLLASGSTVLQERRKISNHGVAFIALVIDERGHLLHDAEIEMMGVLGDGEEDDALFESVAEAVEAAVAGLRRAKRRDDEAIEEAARLALRRTVNRAIGKKPVTKVSVLRLDDEED